MLENKVARVTGIFFDIEFKPDDPTIVYASGLYHFLRSTNTGDSFTQIFNGGPTTSTRIAIGVSPNLPHYVYHLTGPPTDTGVFKRVFRSYDSGITFNIQFITHNILGYSSIGWDIAHQTQYDLTMTVSRTDGASIICGGINNSPQRKTVSGTFEGAMQK